MKGSCSFCTAETVYALGMCFGCWRRSYDHGHPAGGPPTPQKRSGSRYTIQAALEDYQFLTDLGLTTEQVIWRIGVTRRTIFRYRAALRSQDAERTECTARK